MLGKGEILLIVVVIFLLFGAKKLPDLAKALRQSIDEFKKPSEPKVKTEAEKKAEIAELESKLENLKK